MTDHDPIRRKAIWNISPKDIALRASLLIVLIAIICVGLILIRPRETKPDAFGVGARYVPSILPVSLETGGVSSEFGLRMNPDTGKEEGHAGIDLAVDEGVPVKATADGKVIFSGDAGTYGKLVRIDHGNGIETRYAHNSVLKVKTGEFVGRGQLIALAGHTGRVRGNPGDHLHYEVGIDGQAVNPRTYLPGNLPRFGGGT